MSYQGEPSLSTVETYFAHWRSTRSNLQTPHELKEQAVSLLSNHTMNEICRGLGVNHSMIKRWREEVEQCSAAVVSERPITTEVDSGAAFVELPTTAAAMPTAVHEPDQTLTLTLTHERGDGQRLIVSGQLSTQQWRWALELVQSL
jgi:transposase-like protein